MSKIFSLSQKPVSQAKNPQEVFAKDIDQKRVRLQHPQTGGGGGGRGEVGGAGSTKDG